MTWIGGWGGIRTHGTLARTLVFKTSALNHSATHPSALCLCVLHPVYSAGRARILPAKPEDTALCPLSGRLSLFITLVVPFLSSLYVRFWLFSFCFLKANPPFLSFCSSSLVWSGYGMQVVIVAGYNDDVCRQQVCIKIFRNAPDDKIF